MANNGLLRRQFTGAALALAGYLVLAGFAAGDTPSFEHAQVETRTLQTPLKDEIHGWISGSTKARWLGYAVAAVAGEHSNCCSNSHSNGDGQCGTCTLESDGSGVHRHSQTSGNAKVHLEASGELAVMYRAENGKVSKIRLFSTACVVDGGGLEVLWLQNVTAAESVALLEQFVTSGKPSEDDRHDSVGKGALAAIALHGDSSAQRVLESFVSPEQPEWLRKDTAFWLGEARGAAGFRMLQKMARNDPSTHLREQVTFALSLSKQPGALTEMIRMAHEDQSSQVRGQALFWLAQKAGKEAENTITGAIENDPDTDVKKKAVFALSQMPKDEGIPKLIEVAQTNKNLEVRKQAMFWLGQSNDPRALAFFEKILEQ